MHSNKKGFSLTLVILCLYAATVLIIQLLKPFLDVVLPLKNCYIKTAKASEEKKTNLSKNDSYEKVSYMGQDRKRVLFSNSNLFGIIDASGKYIINPEYKEIKKCGYLMFCAKKESEYLLFDWNGNLIKKGKYICNIDGIGSKYLLIKDEDNTSLYDRNMNKIFSFKSSNNAKIYPLSKKYLQIIENNNEKLYDFKGNMVLFSENKHVFKTIEKNKKEYFLISDTFSNSGVIDMNNKIIVPFKYKNIISDENSDYLWAVKNSYYTCYDYNGKIVENPDMSKAPKGELTILDSYNYKKIPVPEGKYFIFDENNRPQGITKYKRVSKAGKENYIVSGNYGENVTGVSDKNGNILISQKYKNCDYNNGYIICYRLKGACNGTSLWLTGGKYCYKYADIYYTDGRIKNKGVLY